MTRAFLYLFDILLWLAMLAVLARLLLQWVRADFRNPVSQALVQLTSPILVPLRRLLPAVGRVDSASVLLLLLLATADFALPDLLRHGGLPPPYLWLRGTVLVLLVLVLNFYRFVILVYALMSMLTQAAGGYNPVQSLLRDLCEPILGRIRRVIPPLGNIDLSPLWALIAIQFLLLLLPGTGP